jgi:hypothetical protein
VIFKSLNLKNTEHALGHVHRKLRAFSNVESLDIYFQFSDTPKVKVIVSVFIADDQLRQPPISAVLFLLRVRRLNVLDFISN